MVSIINDSCRTGLKSLRCLRFVFFWMDQTIEENIRALRHCFMVSEISSLLYYRQCHSEKENLYEEVSIVWCLNKMKFNHVNEIRNPLLKEFVQSTQRRCWLWPMSPRFVLVKVRACFKVLFHLHLLHPSCANGFYVQRRIIRRIVSPSVAFPPCLSGIPLLFHGSPVYFGLYHHNIMVAWCQHSWSATALVKFHCNSTVTSWIRTHWHHISDTP